MGILIFAFVLSVLVVFHEWGHYFAAKRLGIRVERFSIGFGPVIFRMRPKETEFCFSLLPLGGYVKLAGESPEDSTGEAWEFDPRPNWHKFIVVVAGPILNALLAFILFSMVFVIGQPTYTSKVGDVISGFPAEAAGILTGDKITQINDRPVVLWEDILIALHENKSPDVKIMLERDGQTQLLDLTARMEKTQDIFGKELTVPRIGITPAGEMTTLKYGIVESIKLGFEKVCSLTKLIVMSLWMLVTGGLSFKESMAGPIGIYIMTQQAASIGLTNLLDFMGRLSVSLFVINLLPIPVLDGGHLFFIIIESIIRKPLSDKTKEVAMQGGMIAILGLTVYVIYQDVIKFGLWDKLTAFVGGL
jgi:regulator of sigma E protease